MDTKIQTRNDGRERKKISRFIVGETTIKVGSEYLWLWVVIGPKTKAILYTKTSKGRNMFVAERLLLLLYILEGHGNHSASTDGGTWYPPQACKFLKVDHHLHSPHEKSVMGRTIQHIRDRTEGFGDYFPCRKERRHLSQIQNWINLFVNIYNKEELNA